jgi:hypothetical protein
MLLWNEGSTASMAGMEAFDPHVEAARLAAAAFRPLACSAVSEMQTPLAALAGIAMFSPEPIFAFEPNGWDLLRDGQRCAAHAAAFADQALRALDPYSATSLPQPRRGLVRYRARGRAVLAMEGGCTEAGWHARIQAQQLAGVRALSMGIAYALVEDLDRLADLGPALDQQVPKDGPARQQLEAFQLGLERLVGLIALLADAGRVVHATIPDGRRVVDLFQLTETG